MGTSVTSQPPVTIASRASSFSCGRLCRISNLAIRSATRKVPIVLCTTTDGGSKSNELSSVSSYQKPGASSDEVGETEASLKEISESESLNAYGSAKIHDFCFGIPYGGFVFGGGLLGFIFSRNPASLANGVLFGGSLLVLSILSLRVWKQGNSSFPFVLGQAVLSGVLFWRSFQAFSLSKKVIPSGFYAFISAAMLCFYSYVMISGGNPPPKKLRPVA